DVGDRGAGGVDDGAGDAAAIVEHEVALDARPGGDLDGVAIARWHAAIAANRDLEAPGGEPGEIVAAVGPGGVERHAATIASPVGALRPQLRALDRLAGAHPQRAVDPGAGVDLPGQPGDVGVCNRHRIVVVEGAVALAADGDVVGPGHDAVGAELAAGLAAQGRGALVHAIAEHDISVVARRARAGGDDLARDAVGGKQPHDHALDMLAETDQRRAVAASVA